MPVEPSPAVLRAAEVLQALAARPSERWSVSEVARRVGLPRATCDTVLLALAQSGLVHRDGSRRYRLGPACIGLGDAARVANPALRAASGEAEALGRSVGACTVVSIRDGDEIRVANVFDFGPPFGVRARVGESIQLVPPFGASFVAWDDDEADGWLARAEPPLDDLEAGSYRAALDAVRRRGYSFTLVTGRQPDLVGALERLADHGADEARRARDEAVRIMTHSECFTADLDPDVTVRLAQISAPVFGPDGAVAAAVMLLGPNHELAAQEVHELGRLVRSASAAATAASTRRQLDPASSP